MGRLKNNLPLDVYTCGADYAAPFIYVLNQSRDYYKSAILSLNPRAYKPEEYANIVADYRASLSTIDDLLLILTGKEQ